MADLRRVAAMADVVADHGPADADGRREADRRDRVPGELREPRAATADAGVSLVRGVRLPL